MRNMSLTWFYHVSQQVSTHVYGRGIVPIESSRVQVHVGSRNASGNPSEILIEAFTCLQCSRSRFGVHVKGVLLSAGWSIGLLTKHIAYPRVRSEQNAVCSISFIYFWLGEHAP